MTLEEAILQGLGKVKAEDIIIYDTKQRSPFYDQMVLATVTSERAVTGVAAYVRDAVLDAGFNVRVIEGQGTPWVIIDCFLAIVCVFTKEEREHFSLEKIYMDTPSRKILD